MRLVIVAPATWLLVASVIGPAPNQEAFKHSITAARQFFGKQEYERALKHVSYVQQMALGQEERAAVVLYQGLILASLGWRQQARASSSFMTALLLNPRAKLPLKTSPQVERHFEEMRARVLKDMTQRLHQRQVSSTQDSLTLSAQEVPSPALPTYQRSTVPAHSHLMPEPDHMEKEFEHFVSTAQQLLEEEEYERALECLQQAQQLALHNDHRATVALYEGIIFLNLGRRQQVRAASSFMLALTLAPQMQLPIKTSAPRE
jgi:hypothetical protein